MIDYIINTAIKERVMLLLVMLAIAITGLWSYQTTPLDAIPDLSDVQVIVLTKFPGQSPQVIEDQITYPLTSAMLAVPKSKRVRGYSFFGLSFVYIIFEDGTDLYWARSRVLESLNYVSAQLPQGITPTLGPDATGVGWIYEYALVDKTGQHDLAQLRSLQDWYLRYPLQTVKGVAEVASVGGYVKQYQVEVDPHALQALGIPLAKVKRAIQRSNKDVGGRLIEMAETEYMVRGLGYIQSVDDLNQISVSVDSNGTPVRLQDIAHVHIGPELRRGVAELNGEGEVAGGVVIMRSGENALATIQGVRAKLQQLQHGLPDGVQIIPVYDRGDLIERAVASLKHSLVYEMLIVSAVLLLFLLHVRSALVAIIIIPLGILMAFIVMRWQGLNANIMSLGGIAIAIGAMVDGAIVMIENAHSSLAQAERDKGRQLEDAERWHVIGAAAKEVGPALFFSLLVITVSFFPILTMQAQEGRLFSPLAFTKTYAMAAAAILSITLVPVLMGYLLRGRLLAEKKNPVNRFLHVLHTPILSVAMRWRFITLLITSCLLVVSYYPLSQMGSEFMPALDEGDILYMPTTFPGISITKAKQLLQQTDKILKTFPEVESVFGKVGRADSATDAAPLSMLETTIRLKTKDKWPDPNKTTDKLIAEMDRAIHFPGLANAWTMPIKTRIDMLSTGIKTPVGIKVSGPDLQVLQQITLNIEQLIKQLPETLSAFGDRSVGGYFLDFDIKRDAIARYGLTIADVQDVVQSAIGGMNISETVEGRERYPINLRYPRELRDNLQSLQRVLIATPGGNHVPLAMVADLSIRRGAPVIKSEDARPNAWVYVDLKTSDIGGYVKQAQQKLQVELDLPVGYTLSWSGQFEYMQRAEKRLQIVVPMTLVLIFVLLYLHFKNFIEPLIVMSTIPFGLLGGIWLISSFSYNLSVATAVGFIALAGMTAEISVLILSFIDIEINKLKRQQGVDVDLSVADIIRVITQATTKRVRPVTMTAISSMAGLLPIMLSQETGADVTQRIAAPMLGGMFSVLLLNLVVLPVLYSYVLQYRFIKKTGS